MKEPSKVFLSCPQCWCRLQTDTQSEIHGERPQEIVSASNYNRKIKVMRPELPQLLSSHFPTNVSAYPQFLSPLPTKVKRCCVLYPAPPHCSMILLSSSFFTPLLVINNMRHPHGSSTSDINLRFIERVSREEEEAMGRKMKFEVF